MEALVPENEAERLAALRRYGVLDTGPDEAFEDIARLAAHVCAAPMATVCFVDEDRVWVKAAVGFPLGDQPREHAFDSHAIAQAGLMTVRDTWNDHRFAEGPLVTGSPFVRFYAGAVLVTPDGARLGTLSVMDRIPRSLSPDQAAGLAALCRQAMTQLELLRSTTEAQRAAEEAHRAGAEVRERDERLRLILDQMPAILWTTDLDMRFTSCAGAGLEVLELDPSELVGKTLREYFDNQDPLYGPAVAHEQAFEGGSPAYEHNWNGRRFAIHVMPMRDLAGEITGALGVGLDVTDRMWAEGALFETEAKYQGLIETVPAVTYIDPIDEWNASLYVSPQITELLGCSPEQWLTDPRFWRNHVHPNDVDRVWEEYLHARDNGLPYTNEYRMLHMDGHEVWVSERAVMLRDTEGTPWAVQGVIIDITARKKVEEELERAWQRERQTAEHLRRLDELKNLQLHAVSHDLRGPITAILGSAVVLERDDPDAGQRAELTHGIVLAGRKLQRLVNDLLDLDRLERGIVEPNRKMTDLGELARTAVSELDAGGHLVEVLATRLEADVDPAQVDRIIENLVLNAAKHTPVGTPIWVRVEASEGGVMIAVEDAGPGVPPELREAIFEPFRQGGHGPGLGIGLSLVARFAEVHGGWARVEDRAGGGASFRVFLQAGRARGSGLVTADVGIS